MKCKFKPLWLACGVLLLTSVYSKAQNTFPTPSGNVGIGTTSPTADLEINSSAGTAQTSQLIHTGSDGDGYNLPSLKIINQMSDHLSMSPPNRRDIFSVWREWKDMFGSTYMDPDPLFLIDNDGIVNINTSLFVLGYTGLGSDVSVGNDLTINNNTTVGNDLTVNHDAIINNDLRLNSWATGSNKMAVLNTTGYLTGWDLPSLDLSGTTLSLKSGTATLSSVTLPTASGADNLSLVNGVLALRSGSTVLSQVSLPTSSGGDDLGNHTAMQDLDMNNYDIFHISDLYGYAGGSITFNNGRISTPDVLYVGGNSVTAYQLYVNGGAYCTGSWTSSDKRFKKNIQNINSITKKLFNIKPYSYQFRVDEFPEKKFDDNISYGFIAQDVREIFPELVKEDNDGYLAINYTEFIPLLLQALKEEDQQIKEQQTQINQLTEQLAVLTEKVNAIAQKPTGTPGTSTQSIKSTLEQNVPNPFNSETRIAYSIVEKYSKAFIGIYDLSGKEIKQIPLNTAKGEVVLPANNLTPGMYVYSLLVDNQLIDSRKMVIMQ